MKRSRWKYWERRIRKTMRRLTAKTRDLAVAARDAADASDRFFAVLSTGTDQQKNEP